MEIQALLQRIDETKAWIDNHRPLAPADELGTCQLRDMKKLPREGVN